MKHALLIFLTLISFFSFAQSINDYEFVMVPTKFDFQESENEYRLNTLLKYKLVEYGFNATYTSDQLNTNYNDRCLYLIADVLNESSIFVTKLYVVFKDCNGKIVYQSELGTSRIKARKDAYSEAMQNALKSVQVLNYKFTGKKSLQESKVGEKNTAVTATINTQEGDGVLFAQAISNGFQLIDTTPKVLLKIYSTSKADYFIASAEGKNGVVFKNGNEWIFEYYLNNKLVSEKLTIKF